MGAALPPGHRRQPYALQLAAKSFPVTLYTSKDCEPCGAARNLLNARGVPFREVLVVDEPQQEELRKVAGALAVPSVTVGSNVQKGFEESAYHSLLDIAGYPKPGILTPRNQAEPKPAPPPAAAEAKPCEDGGMPRQAAPTPPAPLDRGPHTQVSGASPHEARDVERQLDHVRLPQLLEWLPARGRRALSA